MTKKQKVMLTATLIGCLLSAVLSAIAMEYDFHHMAVLWAWIAVACGGAFKVCAQDFGVWGKRPW